MSLDGSMPSSYQTSSPPQDDEDYDNFHLSSTFLPPEHVFRSKYLYASANEISADDIDKVPVYLCSRMPRKSTDTSLCVDESVLNAIKLFYRFMRLVTGAVPSISSPHNPRSLASSTQPETSIPPSEATTRLPSVLSQISTTAPLASESNTSNRYLVPIIIATAGLYHMLFHTYIAFASPMHFHYPVLTLISYTVNTIALVLSLYLSHAIIASRIPSRLALSTLASAIVPSLTAKELSRGVYRPLVLALIATLLLAYVDARHTLALALASAMHAMGPEANPGVVAASPNPEDTDDDAAPLAWDADVFGAGAYPLYAPQPSEPIFASAQLFATDTLPVASPVAQAAQTARAAQARLRARRAAPPASLDLLSSPAATSSLSSMLEAMLGWVAPASPARYKAFLRTERLSGHPVLLLLLSLLELPCLLLNAVALPSGLVCFTFLAYIATARVRSCWRTMSFITCPISAVHPRAGDADHVLSFLERQYTTLAVGIFSLLSTKYVIDLLSYVTDTADPRLALDGYIAALKLGAVPVLLFLLILLSLAGLQHNITYLNKVVRRFHTQCRLASAIRREWVRLWRTQGEAEGTDKALVNEWLLNEQRENGAAGLQTLITAQRRMSGGEEDLRKRLKKDKKPKKEEKRKVEEDDDSDSDADDADDDKPAPSALALAAAADKKALKRDNRARKEMYKTLSLHIPAHDMGGIGGNILHASPEAWVRAGLTPGQVWLAAGWGRQEQDGEVSGRSGADATEHNLTLPPTARPVVSLTGSTPGVLSGRVHGSLAASKYNSELFPSLQSSASTHPTPGSFSGSQSKPVTPLPAVSGLSAVPSAVSRGEEEAQLRQLADAARTLVSFSFLGWEVDYGGLLMFFLGMAGTATHLLKDKARELL